MLTKRTMAYRWRERQPRLNRGFTAAESISKVSDESSAGILQTNPASQFRLHRPHRTPGEPGGDRDRLHLPEEFWRRADIHEPAMPDNATTDGQADGCQEATAAKDTRVARVAGRRTPQAANGRFQAGFKSLDQATGIMRTKAEARQRGKQADADLPRPVWNSPPTSTTEPHRNVAGEEFLNRKLDVGLGTESADRNAHCRLIDHQRRRPSGRLRHLPGQSLGQRLVGVMLNAPRQPDTQRPPIGSGSPRHDR